MQAQIAVRQLPMNAGRLLEPCCHDVNQNQSVWKSMEIAWCPWLGRSNGNERVMGGKAISKVLPSTSQIIRQGCNVQSRYKQT
jgi:hypothetical protein